MNERLVLIVFADSAKLEEYVREELKAISNRDLEYWSPRQQSLIECCAHAIEVGAKACVVQRRVLDADFLSEFNAYYSRQFNNVDRHCVRFHFFSAVPAADQTVLAFLDRAGVAASYLGFITLRPVVLTPVGASILKPHGADRTIRCVDEFPVHLAGLKLTVTGTPFMQQDNAVGACAQAAIWMALRTLRRREGDRAHDPAQITGAATKYQLSGRTLPNRTGLTQPQITEAIRAAGYSPHPIPLAKGVEFDLGSTLNDEQLADASRVLHAYVESRIPVLLILYPRNGGHAVVVIGHTASDVPAARNAVPVSLSSGAVHFTHAASWVPNFIVHNDNSGPYRELHPKSIAGSYALEQACVAIPLLPADVFLSGEDALASAVILWQDVLESLTEELSFEETAAMSEDIVLRLLLVEKRDIRRWAIRSAAPPEVKERLRLADLPRRVWVLELHAKELFGKHLSSGADSLVGFILLDSTGDDAASAMVMIYLNLPAFTDNVHGSLIVSGETEWLAIQTPATSPVTAFRDGAEVGN
jgi:hypothetical protein